MFRNGQIHVSIKYTGGCLELGGERWRIEGKVIEAS